MHISKNAAMQIVDEISQLVKQNINLMDETGHIIASCDKSRIGDFHYGAYKIITECLDEYYLKKDDKERGMKQGINLPLELDGEIVGVVGITGSHDEVITAGRLIKKMTEILLMERRVSYHQLMDKRVKNAFFEEWLINDGYKEILLLGQNVNSYGKEYDFGFAKLLSELDKIPGKYKLSFMTSHPKDCTHELIDTIADSRHISYHLHLPVQCGSDRILKEMNRHYDTAHYLELIEYAKRRIPKVALTTDIIVGFPGETYEDFLGTVELMKKVRYDSAYTFIYSKREGTKAAAMPDPISDEDKGKWFRQLLDVQNSIGEKAYERFIGDEVEVLCEGIGRTADGLMTGHSRHGVIVDFNGTRDMIGKYVTVRIQKALPWAVTGELVSVND